MAGTLTITSPAADFQTGISTSSITLTWSFAGTGGATQTQRRVFAQPVGGDANTFDTGMAASGATSQVVSGLATGVSYWVTVVVIDSAGATTNATRGVVSNYTRPLPPILTADTSDEMGPVLSVTNPSDGQRPAVTVNTVYRRIARSGRAWTVLSSVGPNFTGYVDYEAAASTSYEYFVRANGQSDSDILTVTTAPMTGAWVHSKADHSDIRHYPFAAAASESVDLEGAFHSFVGRTYAVQETGVARSDSLAVSLRLLPDQRQAAEWSWRNWKRGAPVLFYRDGRGRAWPVGIDGPVTLAPDGNGATITATLRRVDAVETALAAGAYNSPTSVDGGYGVGGYGTTGYGA